MAKMKVFLLQLNIRSIDKNFESFKMFLLTLNSSFSIMFFETWLNNSNVDSSSYEFPNYVSVHEVGTRHIAGGVSIYIHKNFKFKIRNYLSVNC